ncbi:hypothetical protein Ate02nite_52640 [Paractinoplanes tereljensis]|uniref:Nickel/cobalt efflux system n=2 Tax=Paractinoplanes tereljensis TaxID=571912 RepID=A0A919TUQ3_9ACTN|nr:hypothetical protein Ate02nite_52640 [Actinoplanes tereljensis]
MLAAGVLVAPDFIAALDADGDGEFSSAEGRDYAAHLLAKLTLRIDETPMSLTLASVELPTYPQTKAGYGVLHVTATSPLSPAVGDHALFYRNDFIPPKPQYEAVVLAPKNAPITVGTQNHDEAQREVRTVFTVGESPAPAATDPPAAAATDPVGPAATGLAGPAATGLAPAPAAAGLAARGGRQPTATAPAGSGWGVERLLSMLQDPSRSIWLTPAALGLAMVLGAFHALTPGHGKTMMAAYLVGSGGRVRDALALGVSVTVTHTSSVLAIGAVALLASHFAVPDLLVPALELTSGLLVLGLGLRLLWQRRSALPWSSHPDPTHGHGHTHSHGHDHTHGHDLGPAHSRGRGSKLAHGDGRGTESADGHDHGLKSAVGPGQGVVLTHSDGHALKTALRDGHGLEQADGHSSELEPAHSHDEEPERCHEHGDDRGDARGPGPAGRRVGLGSVVALGVAGGLVPCPEALGVMILAVGLGHIAVGMLLILSFSVGLAAVLISIGVLLVRARTFAALSGRFQTGAPARWARYLPLISAVVVVALGAGLIFRTR